MSETPPPPGESSVPEDMTPTKNRSQSQLTADEREADRLAAENQLERMSASFTADKVILFTVSYFC